jgi:hypothetical protein
VAKTYCTADKLTALMPDTEGATLYIDPSGLVTVPYGVSLARLVETAVQAWAKAPCSAEIQLCDALWLSGDQIAELASRFGIR